jgi:hypothetical protein
VVVAAVLGSAVVALGLVPRAVAALVPQKFNDQGRLFDATGTTPVTGMHTMKFAIYSVANGGTAAWSQTLQVMFDSGYYSVDLDGSATSTQPFPPTLWSGAELYMGITIDTDAELSPRQPIDSIPYALVAQNAIGDITPNSVAVAGATVIDSSGNWTGVPLPGTEIGMGAVTGGTGGNLATGTVAASNIVPGSLKHTHTLSSMIVATPGCGDGIVAACPAGWTVSGGGCTGGGGYINASGQWQCDFGFGCGCNSGTATAFCLTINATSIP